MKNKPIKIKLKRGDHIEFFDKDGKFRIGKVVKIGKFSRTIVVPIENFEGHYRKKVKRLDGVIVKIANGLNGKIMRLTWDKVIKKMPKK